MFNGVVARLTQLVTEYLCAREFVVGLVTHGDSALAAFEAHSPGAVVLDLMVADLHGMVVCREIRTVSAVPILILTARQD